MGNGWMLTWGELHTESMLALINSTYSNQLPMPVPHSSQSMFMICCVSSPHSSQSQAQSQEDGAGLQLHPSGSRPSLFFSSRMVGPKHSVLSNRVGPEHATPISVGSSEFVPSGWCIPTPTSNPSSKLSGGPKHVILVQFKLLWGDRSWWLIYLLAPGWKEKEVSKRKSYHKWCFLGSSFWED